DPPDATKPAFPLSNLLRLVIYGSEAKALPSTEICAKLIERFSWYKQHQKERDWK
ncbi:hypothetical protein C8R46DRAFT_836481, partial [Mycena filopes]